MVSKRKCTLSCKTQGVDTLEAAEVCCRQGGLEFPRCDEDRITSSQSDEYGRISLDVLQELAYRRTEGDEVEDLVALLAYAQQQVPGLQAVTSGAIASDYQRTRVEHVSFD